MSEESFLGKQKGLLFVVSGPAGSGKGTVMQLLMQDPEAFALSVSATTRAPGKNEKDGREYFFVSREKFEDMIAKGELLEYTDYLGNYYGTPRAAAEAVLGTGRHLLLEIDVNGGKQIKKAFPEAVLVMIVPPGAKEQERRLRSRARDSEESILRRLEKAGTELDSLGDYDYVIVNETGKTEETAETFRAIVAAEAASVRRHPALVGRYFAD